MTKTKKEEINLINIVKNPDLYYPEREIQEISFEEYFARQSMAVL